MVAKVFLARKTWALLCHLPVVCLKLLAKRAVEPCPGTEQEFTQIPKEETKRDGLEGSARPEARGAQKLPASRLCAAAG